MALRFNIGPHHVDPAIFLAPMAGITDLPFRQLVSSFGVGMVVSEMVASHDMINARVGSREKTFIGHGFENTAVQLAGREAKDMAEAARMVADQGAKIIDINMGCPAKKVVTGYSGAALMRDLDHALSLIDAVVGAVDIPITLKTRLGWDDNSLNAVELAIRAENAGIKMLTIHGRTRCQFYKGQANWQAVRHISDAVSIPVVINGDIVCATSASEAMMQSGANGVMIGRGAQGRPWILAQILRELSGEEISADFIPKGQRWIDMIIAHFEAGLAFYGENLGLRVMRKHLNWHMETMGIHKKDRVGILTDINPKSVISQLRRLCEYQDLCVAVPQQQEF